MKQHSGSVGRIASLRMLASRFAFLSLVMAAFGLMAIGKADVLLAERARSAIADGIAPVLDVLSRPTAAVADVVENVRHLVFLRSENARLQEENLRLLKWQTVARQLEAENGALRSQLNFIPDPDPAYITARVIGDTGGAFVNAILINAGSRDGVRKGQAVISGEVLIGRVAEVGLRSSRILLITDINSRIPVMVEPTRAKAVLAGENAPWPKLNYLAEPDGIKVGNRIITSAHGGAFPPGIPVGVVASVADGLIRIEPFIARHQLEIVTLVDFGLGGILSGDLAVREGAAK